MKNLDTGSLFTRLTGLTLLFMVVAWAFYIHLPTMAPGYLNAGDDHIHVAIANELARIWQDEGKVFGWSRLYAAGSPMFVLRPPGLYVVTVLTHFISGLSVEQSLKVVVMLAFSLYPLSMFLGCRLLGLGFWGSVFSGMLAVLPISLWGHTIDAYQYLGVHKQLLAIFVFPVAVGALWSLLKDGRHGFLFAVTFAIMFMTHPYIAYCYALLVPCMFLALISQENGWPWQRRLLRGALWGGLAFLLVCVWLIPFVFSQEIQVIDPYLSRRKAFDVVVCTLAETLRQFFLGGILDTSRFAEPFGKAFSGGLNEWGWLDNSNNFRLPLLTLLAFVGWLIAFIQRKSSVLGFMSLAFLLSFILLSGPDDFPWLDAIPFAKKFQNIHAIFIFEWVAIVLGGVACQWLYRQLSKIPGRHERYSVYLLATVLLVGGFGSCIYERTLSGSKLIDVRNIYTENGEIVPRPGMLNVWQRFQPLLEKIDKEQESGNISAIPESHDDSVLYNLMPLMVDRPVFISGFEQIGGIYALMVHRFRSNLRDNERLQRLFNVRFLINSPYFNRNKKPLPESVSYLYKDDYWELARVAGDFGELEGLPQEFTAFIGDERQWAELMEEWLVAVRRGDRVPWLVNLVHAGLQEEDILRLKPYLQQLILSKEMKVPAILVNIARVSYDEPAQKIIQFLSKQLIDKLNGSENGLQYEPLEHAIVEKGRKGESFRVKIGEPGRPILFKRAFYRGWRATIDGEKIPVYRVSPGLQMVIVPPGEHVLRWNYTGPNHWGLALAAFWLALGGGGLLAWWERKKRAREISPIPEQPMSFSRKILRSIPTCIWVVFIGVFSYKVTNEAVFKKPVTILPTSDSSFQTGTEDFYWNYVVGIPQMKQQFQLEIARDPEFKQVVEKKTIPNNQTRFNGKFVEQGPYYYRLRLESEGKEYRWTRPVRFYGHNNQ